MTVAASALAPELVLAAARALRFVREEPRASNRGQGVRAMLAITGLDEGHPWCAAFVAYAGVAALGGDWPVPRSARVADLAAWAERRGVLRAPETARRGDLVVLWYPSLGRFAHVAFATADARGLAVATLEGNTNAGGSRDGWGVFERTRVLGPRDRVIRWSEASP